MYQTGCRHFSGYRPCKKNSHCNESCPSLEIPQMNLLIVHLGAMGSVLRATALLPMIQKKYPKSHITWVTETPALLENHPQIDRVISVKESDLIQLAALEFDVALILDKSLFAASIVEMAKKVDFIYGFKVNQNGAIEPANASAFELWDIGLDNNKKFYTNTKTELQLQAEALSLPYQRFPYSIYFNSQEKQLAENRKYQWSHHGFRKVVGINTGCGPLLPEKKINLIKWKEILAAFKQLPEFEQFSFVLLGGNDDIEFHRQLYKDFPFLKLSPLNEGIRSGLCSVEACDIVISGDSLGMHMAIGLKKYVIAWFGPSCSHEIDLYEKGEMILSSTFSCSPCWKRQCLKIMKCHDGIEPGAFCMALERADQFLDRYKPAKEFINISQLDFIESSEQVNQKEHEASLMSVLNQLIL